jgi:uncharacterized membrane protein
MTNKQLLAFAVRCILKVLFLALIIAIFTFGFNNVSTDNDLLVAVGMIEIIVACILSIVFVGVLTRQIKRYINSQSNKIKNESEDNH